MPETEKVQLGADTVNRKWYVDINTGTFDIPVWTGLFGVTEIKDLLDATTEDSSDFDGEGWGADTTTGLKWGLEGKVKRAGTQADPEAYDPGQEAIRLAAAEIGVGNVLDIRYYEVSDGGPKVEAYRGFVSTTWSPEGGGPTALSAASFKLAGRGRRNPITHPSEV